LASEGNSGKFDLVVIGGGPAGVFAALRGADLGARTALVTRDRLGGMAANDGPVPVRTLAHAARLIRDARQLDRYGIAGCDPVLDYSRLLERVREVVDDVGRNAALRPELTRMGVTLYEDAGDAGFLDAGTIAMKAGSILHAGKVILCTGGSSRRLPIPGFELTVTHSDAWGLTSVPASMLVIGGGATGMQVASVFNAFGAKIDLFEAGTRLLRTEDEDVAAGVAEGFRERGITLHIDFGNIERFEKTDGGVAMVYAKDGIQQRAEADLAVAALGWVAETGPLNLAVAGVETDARGFVATDSSLRTTAPTIYAAGDVTGRMMLAPQAIHQGFRAATNALSDTLLFDDAETVAPMGSFTDPEYAQVGLSEAAARQAHDVEVASVRFDCATRPIIDGRKAGLCKLIGERETGRILGCHVAGDRAVDIVQLAAVAMAAGMPVDELARVPLAFPTYGAIVGRAALVLARALRDDATAEPTIAERSREASV
jgi:dihydrolipoamide dehydrogenase